MINLFDSYGQLSWDLHYSLLRAGFKQETIVLQDDGFLPDDVTSPYQFFTGFKEDQGIPLYFNQVQTPDFWEIIGNNQQAEIFDMHTKRGHIHYATPNHKRLVRAVDWYDDKGIKRTTDRYNSKGYLYAQTTYHVDGRALFTSYFTSKQEEVIYENHVTGNVLLNEGSNLHLFKDKREWVEYYLDRAGYPLERICYNSLALPFMTAYCSQKPGADILFWQEPITDSVPGNMQLILNDQVNRPTKVVVQNKTAYDRLLPLLTEQQQKKVSFLGFQYPFVRENEGRKEALILTNSDQIQELECLVQALPDIQFHIGAITEMSSKLLAFSSYSNVSLYPNISQHQVYVLFRQCDIYLDINHGNEILSAIRAAFEHKMLILAFDNTAHNRLYLRQDLVFPVDQVQEMIEAIRSFCVGNPDEKKTWIDLQLQAAQVAQLSDYKRIVGGEEL